VLRTSALILVIVLGFASTRDLVCQFACAEPDAAHAAATCHESSDLGRTLLQAKTIHCDALATGTTTSAIKPTVAREQAGVTSVAADVNWQPVAVAIPIRSSSRAGVLPIYSRPTVLRI
jgi:hypothetical protein